MPIDLRFPLREDAPASGHLIGYTNVYRNLREALSMAGVDFADGAPVSLHIAPPHLFRPQAGQYNALVTMWEARDLPPDIRRGILAADLLITPSTYCRMVFRRAGYRRPIAVVPLGIWAEQWPNPSPERPQDGIRKFLWVGSRDIRKGWPVLWRAWCETFTPADPVSLTVKTSVDPGEAPVPSWQWGRVAFIAHRLDWHALRELYLTHEVNLCTSVGEGFGLIQLEAMAAGMLVVSPAHTGLRDFIHHGVAWVTETERRQGHYGVPTMMPVPKVSHLKSQLRAAVEGYPGTGSLRAKAVTQARRLTWQHTATGVMAALQRYAGRQVA